MTSASGSTDPTYEVGGEELYRGRREDLSTRGFWADFGGTFGGVVLLLSALMGMLQGVAAIANDDLYSEGSDYLYKFDMTVWGTIHLVIAVLSLVVAIGILARKSWGLVCGLLVAGLSILGNFAFLPRYPIWSLVVIGFDALVMWALLTQLGRKE